MRHITIHAEDEVKRSCQCTGCSVSPNSSYSSHLQNAAETTKKVATERQDVHWQQSLMPLQAALFLLGLWVLRNSQEFQSNYSVLPLGWGFKNVSVHECALLHCQHNCTSDVDSLYRPYSKPGHVFISYWFLTPSGVQTCLFPVRFFLYKHTLSVRKVSCGI